MRIVVVDDNNVTGRNVARITEEKSGLKFYIYQVKILVPLHLFTTNRPVMDLEYKYCLNKDNTLIYEHILGEETTYERPVINRRLHFSPFELQSWLRNRATAWDEEECSRITERRTWVTDGYLELKHSRGFLERMASFWRRSNQGTPLQFQRLISHNAAAFRLSSPRFRRRVANLGRKQSSLSSSDER